MTGDCVYIYGLYDPRSNECRYVGKTCDMGFRLRRHIQGARLGADTYCARWVKILLAEGVLPEIRPLSVAFPDLGESWEDAERAWISSMAASGSRLTNIAVGGRGGLTGYRHSQSALEKIGAAHRGKIVSASVRWKISASKKGKKLPPRSDEYRAKISAALKGKKKSQLAVENMRAARWGK